MLAWTGPMAMAARAGQGNGDSADTAVTLTVNVICKAFLLKILFHKSDFYILFKMFYLFIICPLLFFTNVKKKRYNTSYILNQLIPKKLVSKTMIHDAFRQRHTDSLLYRTVELIFMGDTERERKYVKKGKKLRQLRLQWSLQSLIYEWKLFTEQCCCTSVPSTRQTCPGFQEMCNIMRDINSKNNHLITTGNYSLSKNSQ